MWNYLLLFLCLSVFLVCDTIENTQRYVFCFVFVSFQKGTKLSETPGLRPLPKNQFPQKSLCSRLLSLASGRPSQLSQTPFMTCQGRVLRELVLMLIGKGRKKHVCALSLMSLLYCRLTRRK